MKTIEEIRDLMVGKSVITNLADLLRANDEEFAESEKKYLVAVETLRSELPTEFVPTLDAYLDACEVIRLLLLRRFFHALFLCLALLPMQRKDRKHENQVSVCHRNRRNRSCR